MKKNRLDKNRGTAKRRRGMLHQLHAKMHRLPAHLTGEDEWQPEQSGVRLSRVFGMVLGIHVAAIGGLIAYEKFRHQPNGAEVVMKEATATTSVASAPAATEVPRVVGPANPALDNPANEGLQRHVVGPQERLSDIALLYNVDERELRAKNLIGPDRPVTVGMELVIPNRQLVAVAGGEDTPLPSARGESKGEGVIPKAELVMEPVAGRTTSEADLPEKTVMQANTAPKVTASTSQAAAAPKARIVSESTKSPVKPVTKKSEVVDAKKNKPQPAPKTAKTKNAGRVHVVKDGETAYRIARSYGVNVDKLVRTNGINPKALRPGTKLVIPASQ